MSSLARGLSCSGRMRPCPTPGMRKRRRSRPISRNSCWRRAVCGCICPSGRVRRRPGSDHLPAGPLTLASPIRKATRSMSLLSRIMLSARDSRGLFYAAVTLWELCTPGPARGDDEIVLPAMRIDDSPQVSLARADARFRAPLPVARIHHAPHRLDGAAQAQRAALAPHRRSGLAAARSRSIRA